MLAAYKAFGPGLVEPVVLVALLFGLFFAGTSAHAHNNPIPFWKCVAVYVLVFLWGTSHWHTGHSTNGELVFTAVVVAVGIVVSFSSIRHGDWATKIMASIIFLPATLYTFAVIYHGLRNWNNIIKYWSGE